jgi:hypothetical protein
MTSNALVPFSWGALTALCAIAGLLFLRFWRDTKDRLFLFFALAFWTFSLSWAGRLVVESEDEASYLLYLFRLAAFLLIIAGIVDKNWRSGGGGR